MRWPLFETLLRWERRHPCRRVSGLAPRRAGKDAGAPSRLMESPMFAVAQILHLLYRRLAVGSAPIRTQRSADFKSALQQSATLRYILSDCPVLRALAVIFA